MDISGCKIAGDETPVKFKDYDSGLSSSNLMAKTKKKTTTDELELHELPKDDSFVDCKIRKSHYDFDEF